MRRALLAAGASPIDAVKAIRAAFAVSLGQAKVVVDRNRAPSVRAATEPLRDMAEAVLVETQD